MKIFLISNMYPDSRSPGYGIFVKNIVDGLSKHGIEIKCSSLIIGRSPNLICKIYKYLKFYLSICIGFFREYDAIYLHYPNHALPILFPLLTIHKQLVIVNLHGEDLMYSGFFATILGKLNDYFLKKAEKIIVPSNYFKEEVLKRCMCKEDKIFISPSGGINDRLFYPLNRHSGESNFCLGFVGRIEESKGIKEFVEALFILNQSISCEGIIIGYGPFERNLLKMLERLKLSDKVKVIKGVRQENLCEYYNLFSLFIFLSNRKAESLGLVGIEAMACGTPVVGTSIGGIASYLIDGYNGFIVDKEDIHSIANTLIRYHSLSEVEKEVMRENCLLTSQRYFQDIVSKELADVFHGTISS